MLEGDELDVQQSSPVESATEAQDTQPQAEAPEAQVDQPSDQPEAKVEDVKPHPLDPEGDRFKQVWARAKAAEAKAAQVEAEARSEREERIRLEERLRAQVEARKQVEPEYSWDQLQAAVDAGTITFAKAMEIRETQLEKRWESKRQAEQERDRTLSSVSTEMTEYKKLVPNATVPGTDERQKIEREYGYLVQRLGQPQTKEQTLSYELAAARAAFGDLDTLKTKQTLSSKPIGREAYMDTSSASKKPTETKKDFRSSLSTREVQHYERLMRNGRYPGGWDDVKKEYDDYDTYKKSGV
jgi:hypothetical protein